MKGLIQVAGGVVANAGLQGGIPHHQQPDRFGFIGQGKPANLGFVAVFLGQDIGHVLGINRTAIKAKRCANIAIDVIFVRPASIPAELLKAAG